MDNTELQHWVALQSAFRALQHADGWDAFVRAIETRRQEALEDLLKEGPSAHDRHVGFIDGLDWVKEYPDILQQHVERLRADQPG